MNMLQELRGVTSRISPQEGMCSHLLPPCNLLRFGATLCYFSSPVGLRKLIWHYYDFWYKKGSSTAGSLNLRIEVASSSITFKDRRDPLKIIITHRGLHVYTGMYGHCSGNSNSTKVTFTGTWQQGILFLMGWGFELRATCLQSMLQLESLLQSAIIRHLEELSRNRTCILINVKSRPWHTICAQIKAC
jgi:hypothetical protein